MKSIRLEKYKCFDDTGDVELKPLNLLVGSNSSGKSSFLEFFPLLQQSMKINRDGAFLWVGSNVDTNNFDTVVKKGENEITVAINIGQIPMAPANPRAISYLEEVRLEIVITHSIFFNDYISNILISFNGQKIRIELNETGTDKIEVNGEPMTDDKDTVFHSPTNSLLPLIVFDAQFMEPHSEKYTRELFDWFKSNQKNDRIMPMNMVFRPKIAFNRNQFEAILKRQLKNDVEDEKLDHIYNLSLLYNINALIDNINYYMLDLSDKIEFIQPLRANAERYYRRRNISVNRISPSGDNTAMFFLRLKKESKLDEFNDWLSDNGFEFKVDLNEEGGFIEMKIKEKGKEGMNLVDVGCGYSQILPIIATIWKELYYDGSHSRISYCPTNLILIEQPELHLHPRFTKKFTDMLLRCVSQTADEGIDVKFIIETHSQDIINNVGQMVAYKKVDPSMVNIYIFNGMQENMKNYIEKAGFTEDGFLDNWPVGFFN